MARLTNDLEALQHVGDDQVLERRDEPSLTTQEHSDCLRILSVLYLDLPNEGLQGDGQLSCQAIELACTDTLG